jgi:hypothetical protein
VHEALKTDLAAVLETSSVFLLTSPNVVLSTTWGKLLRDFPFSDLSGGSFDSGDLGCSGLQRCILLTALGDRLFRQLGWQRRFWFRL